MNKEKKPILSNLLQLLIGFAFFLLGSTVMYGWLIQNLTLVQVLPTFVPMQFNAALCFTLTGVGLIILTSGFRHLSRVPVFFVFCLAFLTLIEHFFGIDLKIDRLFLTPFTSIFTLHPGRIPPNAALCFVVISAILWLRSGERQSYYTTRIKLFLSFLVFSLAVPVLIGYFIETESGTRWAHFTLMAFHGSIAFTFFGFLFFLMLARENRDTYWFAFLPASLILFVTLMLWQFFGRSEKLLLNGIVGSTGFSPTIDLLLEKRSSVADLILLFGVFISGFISLTLLFSHKIKLQTEDLQQKSESLIRLNVATLNMVEDLQNTKADLQQTSHRLDLALSAGKIGTWSWNIPDDLITVDRHIYPLFNRTKKNFPEKLKDFLKLISPEDQERALREINLSIRERKELNTNWPVLWPDQTVHFIASRGEVYLNEKGEAVKITGVSFDITKEKELERMKNEFISTVSHELRTPLTSIRGSLGIVAAGMAGEVPQKAKELIEIGINNCDRLTRLITDILDLEKMESGKMKITLTPTLLLPLVRQSIEISQADAHKHQIKLVLEKELPEVQSQVDGDKVIQAITNLLSNAIKFSPTNGTVKISMLDHPSSVRISVSDQGPGISEEFKSRIFQKFSQADSSDTRHKSGTGLGLSISKGIIERMNGKIGFETGPKGSVFYFDLPKSDETKKEAGC